MKELTIKAIEKQLQEGWTTKQFTEYYDMNEKEFLSSLDKLSSVKTYIDSVKRRLSKNNKKFRQIDLVSNTETEKKEDNNTEATKTIETNNFNETYSIDALLKRKEIIIASIKRSEDFISKTPSYIAHLEEQKTKTTERYTSYMEGYQKRIDAAIARENSVREQIQQNSEELNRILAQIESLSNINVTVTQNGEIIIENNAISIPSKWQDACFDIMRDDSFKDLEIKDMKTLAKLWSLLNSEENLSKKIKISFESSDFEKKFELLKEHKKN